ncbi:8-oxo-dGTP pyrophosphatase MutT (NUDIX family) [Sphingomonas zeicaulis]|uniref:NUDIX hydrolase n=1 Tax=Sphingomonas zeicaulis TaxID=1632740 RepID=UPI003D23EE5D
MTSDSAAAPASKAIPAATLVLFRERVAGAPPELLMVERSGRMAFAAQAMVFPGGRVDPDDHRLAARFTDLAPEDAAARIAAIRETIEESGIAVGLGPVPDAAGLADLRAALAAGGALFSELLDRRRVSLDLTALAPFARWCPKGHETRIFDTRFYLARAAPDAPEPLVDATENVHALWISAADVLEAGRAGTRRLIFPTRRNLERLAQFASHADAIAHAASHPISTISPWVETRDGEQHLCIPAGLGYPVTAEPLASALRG